MKNRRLGIEEAAPQAAGAAVVVVGVAAAAILPAVISAKELNFTIKYVNTTATPIVWKYIRVDKFHRFFVAIGG